MSGQPIAGPLLWQAIFCIISAKNPRKDQSTSACKLAE